LPLSVTTDLSQHIRGMRLMDTHEHMRREDVYVQDGPDILCSLFENYVGSDLLVAGASPAAVARLTDKSDTDISARFLGIRDAWERIQFTGYGQAVSLIARHAYGIEELTVASLMAVQENSVRYRQPGERLRILREVANLDHIQTDDSQWQCLPDESGPDFFLYDLSWVSFSSGRIETAKILQEVGVEVRDLSSLREAMTAIFAKHGPCAIAVKTQHAYNRTLQWHKRDEAEVERVLQKQLNGAELSENERLCLGDWCLARGVELAIAHNLPFKIHTGYYAGHSNMPVDRIRSGNLCALLAEYPKARFVLMHIAYPYSEELVAIAKHYPNVYVDLCWAWSINPLAASQFVRHFLHAVPANKLFGFGGDTHWPLAALGYAVQARQWLTYSLQAEVDEGLLSEPQAMALATRFMRTNQEECFDLAGTRAAIRRAMESGPTTEKASQ